MPTEVAVGLIAGHSPLKVSGLVRPEPSVVYQFPNRRGTFLYFENGATPSEACVETVLKVHGLDLQNCVIPLLAHSRIFAGQFPARLHNVRRPAQEVLTEFTRERDTGISRRVIRYHHDASPTLATVRFRPLCVLGTA